MWCKQKTEMNPLNDWNQQFKNNKMLIMFYFLWLLGSAADKEKTNVSYTV